MILALWAAAMSTGAGLPGGMTAARALDEQLAGLWCPATPDGLDGPQMTG